ncbi:hypothetical protein ACF0H5_004323 [Mactra antiquata]
MDQYCTVYLWENGRVSPGHISMELPNKVYISFWPRPKGQKGFVMAPGSVYPSFVEETEQNGQPTRTLKVPGLDVSKMFAWWCELKPENPMWNVASFNCSDAVFTALCEGSEWFKTKGRGIIKINTPTRVASIVKQYIDEMTGDTRNSSSSSDRV